MKKIQIILATAAVMILTSVNSYAFGPGFDPDVEPYAVPLDGGMSLLALAGVAYGVRMYMKNKPAKVKA
ncbi:hypothetical protein CAP35_08080 [Chitinophagaceae bacterium IBVUCB1]|nr:hypothetical protein CAP35_08080 [Chitinophagaceae bacterium IBVUCB1]